MFSSKIEILKQSQDLKPIYKVLHMRSQAEPSVQVFLPLVIPAVAIKVASILSLPAISVKTPFMRK